MERIYIKDDVTNEIDMINRNYLTIIHYRKLLTRFDFSKGELRRIRNAVSVIPTFCAPDLVWEKRQILHAINILLNGD